MAALRQAIGISCTDTGIRQAESTIRNGPLCRPKCIAAQSSHQREEGTDPACEQADLRSGADAKADRSLSAAPRQLKAIFGWSTLVQPELYAKAGASRR